MSKRRRSRKSSAAKRRQAQAARRSRAKMAPAPRAEAPIRSGEAKQTDFASEYRYVVSDLKRFALLAVGMFATLIVLALVLR